MDLKVTTLDGKSAGSISVPDDIFGLEPRTDILARTVRWQLAKRQSGTHNAKTRNEIQGTGAKMFKQKGTGRARHGDKKAPQFRGGGKAFGPVPRSHEHGLPKKVRALALKHALSAKAKDSALIVVDALSVEAPKTKSLRAQFEKLGIANALLIGGDSIEDNFRLAARNIGNIDVLPVKGINVYDVLRRHTLVLTKDAVTALEERLK
jgi:large subunit ribosomal protein L4